MSIEIDGFTFRRIRDFNLLACSHCFAVVSPNDIGSHITWHEALGNRIAQAATRWNPEPVLGSDLYRHQGGIEAPE